ncbi:MAG: cation:proton antiporter subunit C [Opitutales bacterium]
MFDLLHDYYAYWAIMILLVVGLYGMLFKENLMKKVIGMIIFQNSIILFFVTAAFKWDATVPVVHPDFPTADAANYLNPLPHTLMLTAIVVGVATVGVAFAILISIYRNYGTMEEQELLERMK